MSHLQICSLKIYLKSTGGGGGGGVRGVRLGGGGQDGCERRIKVFVKIQNNFFFFLGGGGGGSGWGGQGRCEQRSEVWGGDHRVDVNKEFLRKFKNKTSGGGGGGGGGGGEGGGGEGGGSG